MLQTDGGFKTGRDVAIAAALGAEEYGFGTAALVAVGCVMARQCHLNTCPAGIATQRPDLRAKFTGTPEMLVGYLRLVAGETRTHPRVARPDATLDDLIGRADLLRARADAGEAGGAPGSRRRCSSPRVRRARAAGGPRRPAAAGSSPRTRSPPRRRRARSSLTGPIRNTDRAYGAAIAGAIAARRGDAGLRDGSVRAALAGSAGQSFGAFARAGHAAVGRRRRERLLGKGMHGGEIVVRPPARQRGRQRQALVGNTALYGATGGRVFIAGAAGERFAVRNSGATAVVEGVGDHGCEYMTGGVVLILGATGRNFGAGMTGGVAYVHDPAGLLARHGNAEMPAVAAGGRRRPRGDPPAAAGAPGRDRRAAWRGRCCAAGTRRSARSGRSIRWAPARRAADAPRQPTGGEPQAALA